MNALIHDVFALIWQTISRGYSRSQASKPISVVPKGSVLQGKDQARPALSQDASPPGTKVRWWV